MIQAYPPVPVEAVFDRLQVGVLLVGAGGGVLLWNRWLEQRTGRSADDVVGSRLATSFPELGGTRLLRSIETVLRDARPVFLSQALNRSPMPVFDDQGRRLEQALTLSPLTLADGSNGCLVQIQDVTASVERERALRAKTREAREVQRRLAMAYETLERTSQRDGLTGVFTRRYFESSLEIAWHQARAGQGLVTVIMVDVDHFKRFNDTHGHASGDAALAAVGRCLEETLSRGGDVAARYGGEEFVLLVPGADADGARAVGERVRAAVAAVTLPEGLPGVTVSVGTSSAPATEDEPWFLVTQADAALYKAKRAGRDRVVCFEGARFTEPPRLVPFRAAP